MKLHRVKIKIETGKPHINRFALRIWKAEDKDAAALVEQYDIAFISGQYGDAFILARMALERGASAIMLNSETCSADTKSLIAALCGEAKVPLIDIEEYSHFDITMDLFQNEVEKYEKKRLKLNCELQNMLMFRENPRRYPSVMERYGDVSNVSCCAAVLKFVCKENGMPDSRLLAQAERLAETGANEAAFGTAAVCVGSQMALIFDGKAEQTVKIAVQSAVEAISAVLADKFDIYIGTGGHYRGMENLYESFFTASKAAGLQVVRRCPQTVLSYEELGISKLLMEVNRDSGPAKDFYRETIQPLVEYDKRNGTHLVNFLRVYFKYGGCKKKIGEELYMHRNSVNYKLNKIAEIVTRDLSDTNDRLELFVALKLYELSFGDEIV